VLIVAGWVMKSREKKAPTPPAPPPAPDDTADSLIKRRAGDQLARRSSASTVWYSREAGVNFVRAS
jgi:hypothetical protein